MGSEMCIRDSFYSNAGSLSNKLNELKTCAELYEPHVICITETHLMQEVLDAEIQLNNYTIFRKDRVDGKEGGGSAVYVHNGLTAAPITSFNAPDSFAIRVNHTVCPLVLVCVYRSQALTSAGNREIINQVMKLQVPNDHELVVVGDWNLRDVCWDTGVVKGPKDTTNKLLVLQKNFLEMFHNKGLHWLLDNSKITRRRIVNGTLQESRLDQVLVTNPALVHNVSLLSGLGVSAVSYTHLTLPTKA